MREEKSCFNCTEPENMQYHLRKYKWKELLEQIQRCLRCSVWDQESSECYYEPDE